MTLIMLKIDCIQIRLESDESNSLLYSNLVETAKIKIDLNCVIRITCMSCHYVSNSFLPYTNSVSYNNN